MKLPIEPFIDSVFGPALLVTSSGALIYSNKFARELFPNAEDLSSPVWLARYNECLSRGYFETSCGANLLCRMVRCTQDEHDQRILLQVHKTHAEQNDRDVDGVQSARLHELSQMAAGIAHEVNNPMTVIYARSQILLSDLESRGTVDADLLKTSVTKILSQSERVTKIIKSLQSFSRDSSGDALEPCALKGIIDEVLSLANAPIRDHGVTVRVEPGIASLVIKCRKSEMIQVMFILVKNAVDALATTPEPCITIGVESGDQLRIRVSDNGPGVPEGLTEKIFMPFFSTKAVGAGTGIGLSIASKIISSHGGVLLLNRAVSNSCFEIVLGQPTVRSRVA